MIYVSMNLFFLSVSKGAVLCFNRFIVNWSFRVNVLLCQVAVFLGTD